MLMKENASIAWLMNIARGKRDMEMKKEELDEILENHVKWLETDGGERADLRKAGIEGNLCGVNLRGANLLHADLKGATLPIGVYQIVGAGSSNRCTTYDTINDQIVCGCWNDGKGNHLDSFIKRIEEIYGPYEEGYNPIYYAEYMAVVNFFKAMKELKENHDRKKGAIL